MTATGMGLEEKLEDIGSEPRIRDVDPSNIVIGETQEIRVLGSGLTPQGAIPIAEIAAVAVPVLAAIDDEVVLDVADLQIPSGSTVLRLRYGGEIVDADDIVTISIPEPLADPPDLQIAEFALDPASPIQNGNTQATITVCNEGGSVAPAFVAKWKPFAGHPGLTGKFPPLDVGGCGDWTANFSYPNPGTFESVVIVDELGNAAETNTQNNQREIPITVQSPPVQPQPVPTRRPIRDCFNGRPHPEEAKCP